MSLIFVFGSNEAGRHSKGAALHARLHHGAIYGQSRGLQGSSYAIPTKDGRSNLRDPAATRSLDAIRKDVNEFLQFAHMRADLNFYVSAIGCGLAGYVPAQIAPMFKDHPANVTLNDSFLKVLQ